MTYLFRGICIIACWLITSPVHATLVDIVLAPPDTMILPEHEIYTRVSTLAEVQQASFETDGVMTVYAYPGYYSDLQTTHLHGVDLTGVTDASFDWQTADQTCLTPYNGYAVFKSQLILHESSLVYNVVVDVGGLKVNGPLSCLRFGGDCDSAIVGGSAFINSTPDCGQFSFGIIGEPPSNSFADDPYLFSGNLISGHGRGMFFGSGFRSGYDPEQDSFDGYSVFYYNVVTNNQTGLAFALGATTDMGSDGFHGENYFSFNEVNILLERNPEDIPEPVHAVGNHWFSQRGTPLPTERQVYRTVNRVDIDDTGVTFGPLSDHLILNLPSANPPRRPRGPHLQNAEMRTVE